MNISRASQTESEKALSREIERLQAKAAALFKGIERTAVIELVRTLDLAAVARLHGLHAGSEDDTEDATFYLEAGSAVALRPFLAAVKGRPGGMPWAASRRELIHFAQRYLDVCGRLFHLRRMAALERYGLASTTLTAGRLEIVTNWGIPEAAAMSAMRQWKRRSGTSQWVDESAKEEWRERHSRMRKYVEWDRQSLIRYDNDPEIVFAYRKEARAYAEGFFEGEAFPEDVVIGDRTFGAWKEACNQALGRVLCHIDFAMLLAQKRSKKVSLRDLIPIFSRREDVAAVWEEAGVSAALVSQTMDALTLSIDELDDWENAYEVPTPLHIDMGEHFVLLPSFGALTNPYFTLFRHLRKSFKADWDRGVDRREAVFRADLQRLFPPERFVVPDHGFKLRRANRSFITDVDAVIFDRESGQLALVQLKWHDVFGRSLAERDSRSRNIASANQWVEGVHSWVNGRSSNAVLDALHIKGKGCDAPPCLLVIARYVARFTGGPEQDARATWLGWPEVVQFMQVGADLDPLGRLSQISAVNTDEGKSREDVREVFRFPQLTVELRISAR